MSQMRLLLADDHDLLLRGLRSVIEQQEPSWRIVSQVTTGTAALEAALRHQPDVAVLDHYMPEMNGIAVARILRQKLPQCEILLLTGTVDPELVREVLSNGVRGYLLKSEAAPKLITAIKAVAEGKRYFSDAVESVVVERFLGASVHQDPARGLNLTEREKQVAVLIAGGKTNKETAQELGLSTKTIETHRANIMRKLGIDTVADLVRYAVRENWISA